MAPETLSKIQNLVSHSEIMCMLAIVVIIKFDQEILIYLKK